MVDDLHVLGKLGADILTAWNAKEELLDLLALARTRPDRRRIAVLLHPSTPAAPVPAGQGVQRGFPAHRLSGPAGPGRVQGPGHEIQAL
jgi:hypothetical protein